VRGDPRALARLRLERERSLLAEQIFGLRERRGWSWKDLAERSGIPLATIARLEDGDCEGYSLSVLRSLAAAFGRGLEIRLVASSWDRRAARRGR
jgi:transcriptional regulator with XRE-family HTH domain